MGCRRLGPRELKELELRILFYASEDVRSAAGAQIRCGLPVAASNRTYRLPELLPELAYRFCGDSHRVATRRMKRKVESGFWRESIRRFGDDADMGAAWEFNKGE